MGGFECLRNFIVHEIKLTTSDYAQALFRVDEKDKLRDSSGKSNTVRVRHAAITSISDVKRTAQAERSSNNVNTFIPRNQQLSAKPKPDCFVCAKKHYLADCDQFKILPDYQKKQTILDAGRCLNCLSLRHTVRNCMHQSKCCKCQRDYRFKHASVLHDYYVSQMLL